MSTKLNMRFAACGVRKAREAASTPLIRIDSTLTFAGERVHEAEGHAARSLALAMASSSNGTVFWVGDRREVCGLRAMGVSAHFDISRLIIIQTTSRADSLWAAEQALRCKGAGLVTIQIDLGPDLFESRRLQIAAQEGSTLGLVLIGKRAQSSAAQTRWRCESGLEPDVDWLWTMTKNKQGQLGTWAVKCSRPPPTRLPPDLYSPSSPIHESVPSLDHQTPCGSTNYTAIPSGVAPAASA